jgi:hypothetical protein
MTSQNFDHRFKVDSSHELAADALVLLPTRCEIPRRVNAVEPEHELVYRRTIDRDRLW